MAEKVTFLTGTPKTFYVRTESQKLEFARLEQLLLDKLSVPNSEGRQVEDKFRISNKDLLKPGFIYGIQYKDAEGHAKFGRVRLGKFTSEIDVTVDYLDLSFATLVEAKTLLRLPKHLRTIPPQVTVCTMFECLNSDRDEGDMVFEKIWQAANNIYMVRLPDGSLENNDGPIPVRLVADIDVSSIMRMHHEAQMNPNVHSNSKGDHELTSKESSVQEMSDCDSGESDSEAANVSRISSWLESSSIVDQKGPPKAPSRPKVSRISDLPRLSITTNEGESFKFLFAHIESPNRFFVHPWEDTKDVFEPFSINLNQFYTEKATEISHKMVGYLRQDSLVAVYSQSKWYRGCLIEHIDANLKKVLMIDNGDTIQVPSEDLRVLDKQFCLQAPLVRECSLEGVQVIPTHIDMAVKLMNEQIDAFGHKSWFIGVPNDVNQSPMVLEVLGEGFINDDGSTQPTLPLNAFLIAKEVCVNTNLTETADWNPIGDDYAAGNNYYDPLSQFPQIPKKSGSRANEPRICRFFQNSGKCMRGEACPDYHLFTGSNAFTEIDQGRTLTAAYNEITLPSKESDTCVQVSCIQSPSNFYIILPWGPIDINQVDPNIFESIENQEQNLEILCNEMTRYYKMNATSKNRVPHTKYTRTEIVAAFCSREKQWLRAQVLDEPLDQEDESMLTVFFVDFGNTQSIALKWIRKIQPAFLHMPFQALQCSLNGVKPLGEEWTKEATEYFFQTVHDKTFVASIERVDPSWPLQLTLRDMDTLEETVATALIKAGFGEESLGGIIGLNVKSKYIPG